MEEKQNADFSMKYMNNIAAIKRPVMRYHGGKYMLAKWIISHLPQHRIYVELFGGGGSVLMQKPRSYAEVYNDVWDEVVNVFEVLRNKEAAKELERLLRLTPFSRTEYKRTLKTDLQHNAIERARQTIFRSFAGFGSASVNKNYETGFRANANRSGSTPAQDWANYPDNIQAFTNRLMRVTIENRDYKKIMAQQDSAETLFYADPPYVHDTRNMKRPHAAYIHEFTEDDHRELAEHMHGIKGMGVVSGYNSALYEELYKDWTKIEKETFADGANKRIEAIWLSPACCKQLKLF